MDHHNHSHADVDTLSMGSGDHGGDHGQHHVPYFFDDMDQGEEEKLLGMLHVPILHGGVREVLLFPALSTDNPLSFTLACVILLVCVTLLELLRLLLWWVESKYSGGSSMMGSTCGCKQCNSLTACIGDRKQYDTIHDSNSPTRRESTTHLPLTAQSTAGGWTSWGCIGLLQFVIYLMSTFLMLIAMTMNIYLILSMALGSMIGKLTVVCLKRKIVEARSSK